jgi:hypothetical protein
MHLHKKMTSYEGKTGLGRLADRSAKRAHDKVCLLKQAMFACASGRPGLVLAVGEKTCMWHAERPGSVDGEWFRGELVAYDPVRVAHFMEFFRVRGDGLVEPVAQNNIWVQLWRSNDYLRAV